MKKVRVGHIGWLARDDGPDCETVAWCDRDETKLRQAGAKAGAIALYADYRDMVRHPGLDAGVGMTAFAHDINAMRRAFIRCLAENRPPVQTTLDAWKTHRVCLAAEQSLSDDGRRVAVAFNPPSGAEVAT